MTSQMFTIFIFQNKFPESMNHHEEGWNPKHGVRLGCSSVVILNALGYIGFKVSLSF